MKQIHKAARIYYVVMFLFFLPFGIYWPLWQVNFLAQGLSPSGLAMIMTLKFLVITVGEIPTGMIGDLFGRKITCLISSFLLLAGFLTLSTSGTTPVLVAGTVLICLGDAFFSGTLTSWIYEAVKVKNGELDHIRSRKLFAMADIAQRAGIVIGSLAGGYLAYIDIRLPWQLAAVTYLVLAVFIFGWTQETYAKVGHSEKKTIVTHISEQMRTIWHDLTTQSTLVWMSLGVLLWGLGDSIGMTFFFPYMKDLSGKAIWIMGYIQVCLSGSRIVGNYLVIRSKSTQSGHPQKRLAGSMFVYGLMILFLGLVSNFYVALGIMILRTIAFVSFNTLYNTVLNKIIHERSRASLLSFFNMVYSFSAAIGAMILSRIDFVHQMRTLWVVSAFILWASCFVFYFVHLRSLKVSRKMLQTVQKVPGTFGTGNA